jgi:acyl dehydratase
MLTSFFEVRDIASDRSLGAGICATKGGRVVFERETVAEAETGVSMPFSDDDERQSTTALYLDDLRVGQRFTSGSLRVEEAEIKAFAAQFDPQPFHLDESAARASLFRGLAASGWHTAALSMRLLVDGGLPIAGGVIGASGELAWPRPTRPGNVLTVETEVLDVVPSKSRPPRICHSPQRDP